MHVHNEDNTLLGQLVAYKAKVALLHGSIPRLKMAAIYGLYVAEKMGKRLELELTDWKFWSYSVHVLYWTHVLSPTFKPFVANRVGYLQIRTSPRSGAMCLHSAIEPIH